MTACAPESLAEISETIACFCSRLRPKVYLLTLINGWLTPSTLATLNQEPLLHSFFGYAACVGNDLIKPAALSRRPAGSYGLRQLNALDENEKKSGQQPKVLYCCAESDAGSTFTPTPIVLDTETFFKKMPFDADGFDLFSASTSAARLSRSCSGVKEARPIVHWTIPDLSARNCTWPARAFFTAPATSAATVPTLGFGIRPRRPRIWPSAPTTRIASGAAITMSKSILPALTCSARSSMPTMSAPASLAACALSPAAKTATRTFFPVPAGNTTAPRTVCSPFLASMPRLTATSTASSNLAVAVSFTSFIASIAG